MSILHQIKTNYHDIKITEENSIRKMIFGNGLCAEQSAINLEYPSCHVCDYSFLAMHSLLITPYPSKILVIGLGGGVIPMEMDKYATNSIIDVIEIDPEVIKLAKEYFFFKESSRLKVHIGDAFSVIQSLKGLYDIIIIDVFFSSYTPFHIMSEDFFKNIFSITSLDGVIGINMANVHPSFNSQINTVRNVFGNTLYYLNGANNPNTTMLFALKKEKEIIKIHGRPLCHFLGLQPERLEITEEIKNAKIFRMNDIKIV